MRKNVAFRSLSLVMFSSFMAGSAFGISSKVENTTKPMSQTDNGSRIETKSFLAKDIKSVELLNQMGNISVTSNSQKMAVVSAEKVNFESHCHLTFEQNGTHLKVEVKPESGLLKSTCHVNFKIETPKNVNLKLMTGKGALNIAGTSGDVSFVLGSGDIFIDADLKNIEGMTGSGNIHVKGLTASGDFKTGSGSIYLTYNKQPQNGKLDIRSGSGNAEVLLPKNTQLNTNFYAGSGKFLSEFTENPKSAFNISMKTGAGDLKLKKM